ncbi:universal stress protein [Natronolimnohabitans innermongolicus]|uniref:Universal stress protein n=1 Tax=Natronolimnohabitans innermongolicus JCM 12255 TaxID=1227499 RepID=L9WY78_9EURY|nr:universal stress protein [Natronolimnohabitans innermongolicus]ELY53318.1 universal stress protein [Natronolimnohabitans innermongolicus JCM 12255]
MFSNILVPTDGSEAAELAVPYAVELAERFEATVYPMYVVDTDAVSHALGSEQVDRLDAGQFSEMTAVHERAADAIDRVREHADESSIDVHPVIEAGVPYREITAFAAENDVDLIVMTSRGRGGVTRALLGSVTERVARNTPVPVLVVDTDDDSIDSAGVAAEPA